MEEKNNVRERILKRVENAKCNMSQYDDTISFNVCEEYLNWNPDTQEEDESDFDEVVVTVEKKWLFNLIKSEEKIATDNEVKRFLEEEYTSDDSSIWFEEAILAKKIVSVDFN